MKPKRVIEIFNALKENSEDTEFTQAIDHAINCVGAIEQIKWERDIAIQQLNDLGFGFGEETNKDRMTPEQLNRHQRMQVQETGEERVKRQMKEYLEPYVRSDEE